MLKNMNTQEHKTHFTESNATDTNYFTIILQIVDVKNSS